MSLLLLAVALAGVAVALSGCMPGHAQFAMKRPYTPVMPASLQRQAERGDAVAQNRLGVAYAVGNGVGQSANQAAHWISRSAQQGNGYGQANLGTLYDWGYGVDQDDEKAMYWWRKAAQQGVLKAVYQLDRLHD